MHETHRVCIINRHTVLICTMLYLHYIHSYHIFVVQMTGRKTTGKYIHIHARIYSCIGMYLCIFACAGFLVEGKGHRGYLSVEMLS